MCSYTPCHHYRIEHTVYTTRVVGARIIDVRLRPNCTRLGRSRTLNFVMHSAGSRHMQ